MKAILVFGIESSGTRLITKLLIACGCEGEDGYEQQFDNEEAIGWQDPIVWRRSFPHGTEVPSLKTMKEALLRRGYEDLRLILTVRDWRCTTKSQYKEGQLKSLQDGVRKQQRIYQEIWRQVLMEDLPFLVISYESLVHYPVLTVRWMAEQLGLQYPETLPSVYDGNEKYSGD